MILALAGGVGGARLSLGLCETLPPHDLSIAVNVGDDFSHLGLHIAPDLDTVMYTLAGINDPVQGWGIAGETWHCMEAIGTLGGDTWFRLGDRDLATHLERTRRLQSGQALSDVTRDLCVRLGVHHAVMPATDQPLRTLVHTTEGVLAFQDYFVRRRAAPVVTGLEYAGAGQATLSHPLRRVLESPDLAAIIICPSNPYLSVGPMLAIAGLREALAHRRVPVLAVSPIIAGQALKGPAAKIMRELGHAPSPVTVAGYYRGLVDGLVMDTADAHHAPAIAALGMTPIVTDTIMADAARRGALARAVLDATDTMCAHAGGNRAT